MLRLEIAGILVTVPVGDHDWEFMSLRTCSEVVFVHASAFYLIGLLYYAWILPQEPDKEAGYKPPKLA